MATCEKIQAVPVPPPATYKLVLDKEEAGMLRQLIAAHIAGAGCYPMTRILRALEHAGVERGNHVIVARRFGTDDSALLIDPV